MACYLAVWHQANIWTNAGLLLIGLMGTNFSEIWFKMQPFLYKKINQKCCLQNGFNVLIYKQTEWQAPITPNEFESH